MQTECRQSTGSEAQEGQRGQGGQARYTVNNTFKMSGNHAHTERPCPHDIPHPPSLLQTRCFFRAGGTQHSYHQQRGVKQGRPLSPLLFCVVYEIFFVPSAGNFLKLKFSSTSTM